MKKLAILLVCFLFAGMQMIQAQGVSITGRTIDGSTGESLPGVTVQVAGTTTGAISQADGTYTINNVPSGATTLIFSFVGYQSQEVQIGGRTTIDVVMEEEVTALEEIVVTGYSVERKKDIIGSVSVVNTEEMLSQASGNVSAQLQGRVAGLTISSGGDTDNESKIRVRGFGSFGNSDPLFIIDGVPGDIDRLNPNDVESVQVLKDAASASVYGARAANGVIIITTKQGREGSVQVNLDSYYGINYFSPNDFPELLSTQEHAEMYWKSMEGAGIQPGEEAWFHPQYGSGVNPVIPEYILVNVNGSRTGGAALEELRNSDPAAFADLVDPANYDFATHQIVRSANTNWFEEGFSPAPVQSHQLSASGGSERGTYAVSMSFFDQKRTDDVKYSYYRRYTLRANSTFNIKQAIRLGENLQFSYNEGRNVGNVAELWTMQAILPVYDIAGNPASSAAPGVVSVGDTGRNPIGEAWRNRFDKNWTYGVFGNAFLEITPLEGLVLRSSFGLDFRHGANRNFSQVTYEHAENSNPPNSLSWSMSQNVGWTFTNTLNYSKTIGSHNFKVLLGTEAINDFSTNVNASRDDFLIDDDLNFMELNAGIGTQTGGGGKSRSALFSLFGRIDYTFADKYIFNATIRRDGSSKFGINNRYGYFPAAALGWRISQENFMSGLTWLTDLKLRASYGIIGNQTGLNNENQFTTYTQSVNNSYPLQGANASIRQSFTASRLGNPNAKWEKAVSTNVGLDASLFAGGLTLTVDVFKRETQDLLVTRQAPETGLNVSQPSINVGNIQNTGLDITLARRGRIAGQVDYDVSANFSMYKNEVIKVLDNPDATLSGGGTRMGSATLTKAGNPISYFYGFQNEGFFNTQAEVDAYLAEYDQTFLPPAVGRWKVKDVNGDKVLNDSDRTYIGDPHPDFTVGMNFQLGYMGFDLSAFVFWQQGGDIFDESRYRVDFNTFQYQRSARMLYESWTPELGNSAKLPKLDLNDTYSNTYVSSYFVEDATYVRLRQLQLGYTIPASLINRIGVDRLRFYVSGQNLITLTKYSGLDPGLGIQGGDLSMGVVDGNQPTPRQWLFGLNLSF